MKGWRKVILAAVFGAVIIIFPLDEIKAAVLQTLILATMGGNAVEHLASKLPRKGVPSGGSNNNSGGSSARAVTDPVQTALGRAPGNDH